MHGQGAGQPGKIVFPGGDDLIFDGLINRLKGAFRNVAQATGIEQAKKDVFDLAGVPSFRQFYEFGVFPWKWIYRGYYKAWHLVDTPTIANPQNQRKMERMDTAKALTQELASLMWSEKCGIAVNQKGWKPTESQPDDPLQQFIDKVLDENGFTVKMQEHVEQTLALGGGALLVWAEPVLKKDENGNPLQNDSGEFIADASQPAKIKIGYYMADQFVPLAWDNAEVSEGLFIRREAKGGYYYTTLSWHKWDGSAYVITNELYRSDQKQGGNGEDQNILGFRRPLDELYRFLSPTVTIKGLKRSLFSYYRPNTANNLDDNSPLGVSVYANSLSTLKAIDIAYDSFIREFVLGRRRIIVPSSAIRKVIDPETGAQIRYFDANDEAYEAMSNNNPDELKITDNTVPLRVEEHVKAINALLGILSFQIGLSPGTLTFDEKQGLKTATEVMNDRQKTYKTAVSHEIPLKSAIERLIDNIIDIAVMYGVDFEGQKISALVSGGYDVNISFDDSIIQDRQTNIDEGIKLNAAGLMSKRKIMIEKLGYTEEEADKELEQIAQESQVTGLTFDSLMDQNDEGGNAETT